MGTVIPAIFLPPPPLALCWAVWGGGCAVTAHRRHAIHGERAASSWRCCAGRSTFHLCELSGGLRRRFLGSRSPRGRRLPPVVHTCVMLAAASWQRIFRLPPISGLATRGSLARTSLCRPRFSFSSLHQVPIYTYETPLIGCFSLLILVLFFSTRLLPATSQSPLHYPHSALTLI